MTKTPQDVYVPTLSVTIDIIMNEKGTWSLTVDGGWIPLGGPVSSWSSCERYVQVRDGYWRDRVGTPMNQALVEMAEHWIRQTSE